MKVLNIPISSITISRERFGGEDRKRNIAALAQSLQTFGQFQPIIVTTRDGGYELEDGYRRLSAAQLNGATEIFAVLKSDVDDVMAREIELEANIQREDLSWQARNAAIAEIHRMKKERNPDWGLAQTSVMVTMDKADVSRQIQLARVAEKFPEVLQAKTFNKAYKAAVQKIKLMNRVEENKDVVLQAVDDCVWLGDSTELIKDVPSEYIDAIITDPPFGVNYEGRTEGNNALNIISAYEDSEESYEKILGMAPEMYRVLKPNGWVIFFFGMTWYPEVRSAFKKAGFTVDDIPVVWDRSDGRTFTASPGHYFTRGYDVALHCHKGDPRIVLQGKPNILRIPPLTREEKELLVERPIELYEELIKRLTVPGERVADFFVGSGSCLAAAAKLGRQIFGCEKDPLRRSLALSKISAHMPQR